MALTEQYLGPHGAERRALGRLEFDPVGAVATATRQPGSHSRAQGQQGFAADVEKQFAVCGGMSNQAAAIVRGGVCVHKTRDHAAVTQLAEEKTHGFAGTQRREFSCESHRGRIPLRESEPVENRNE